ncbi:MAG: hypothetical protein LBV36_09485 [Chromatiales bacterium]|jgi:uncharacterized membrane protein|nr:hypothetical protein [Chromatiales bacterium]
MEPIPLDADRQQSLKTLTAVLYALYGASVFFGVTALIAVAINYLKGRQVAGTWLASHFRWQIRTFWFALLWAALGALTYFIVIGVVIWFLEGVWVIYRAVRGWLNLNENRPMYYQ